MSTFLFSFYISLAATFAFETDMLTVKEGVNMTTDIRLVVTDAPMGGLEGIIEVSLFVSPSGASE